MDIVKRSDFIPTTLFFDDFLTRNMFDWTAQSNDRIFLPKTNILETSDDFRVEVAVPGMKKEDFSLELDKEILTIQSEVSSEEWKNGSDVNYNLREFSYHSFKRSFYLPNTVEADEIEATYEDGILSLVIPKKEEAKKKPVKIIAIS